MHNLTGFPRQSLPKYLGQAKSSPNRFPRRSPGGVLKTCGVSSLGCNSCDFRLLNTGVCEINARRSPTTL